MLLSNKPPNLPQLSSTHACTVLQGQVILSMQCDILDLSRGPLLIHLIHDRKRTRILYSDAPSQTYTRTFAKPWPPCKVHDKHISSSRHHRSEAPFSLLPPGPCCHTPLAQFRSLQPECPGRLLWCSHRAYCEKEVTRDNSR